MKFIEVARKKSFTKKHIYLAIIVIVILWFSIPILSNYFFSNSLKNSAELGDSFGMVNSLFSALAFLLLIYTSLMQKEELELQREELKLTRQELKKSAEAQKEIVRLTQENLDIQKSIRLSDIMPQFSVSSHRFVPGGSNTFEIKLELKYHQLKISKIEPISNKKSGFHLNDFWTKKYENRFLDEGTEMFIVIHFKPELRKKLNELRINITFQDIDSNFYLQVIQFEDLTPIISSANPFNSLASL